MGVSYKRLWKLLIDKDMNKGSLRNSTGVAASTISRMGRNEYVSLEVLEKICNVMNCVISDIVEFTEPDENTYEIDVTIIKESDL